MNPTTAEQTPPCPTLTVPVEDIPVPSLDGLITDDGKPVDNIFVEKLYRLLTEPLYSSWSGPADGKNFLAVTDVGLFFEPKNPPLCPDAMLGVDVQLGDDLSLQGNRSWFVWLRGKVPDVVIEIVSDRRGGEDTYKLHAYARMGIPYYVIFDPRRHLSEEVLRPFALRAGNYEPMPHLWFPAVGLGLMLWEGAYEGQPEQWLRWCDQAGQVIATGRERAEQERQRAERERQRSERLIAQLRALGVEPSE